MSVRLMFIPAALVAASFTMAMASRPTSTEYTRDFTFKTGEELRPESDNPYVPLRSGTVLRYEGTNEDGAFVELQITTLPEIRRFRFREGGQVVIAAARVVEEREWIDGRLVEVSRSYLAASPTSDHVFSLGEDTRRFENGRVSDEGSWRVGRDGARPGLHMPGLFTLGSRYYQELAPGTAMGRVEHLAMGLDVETPAGVFHDCVMVVESSGLDDGDEDGDDDDDDDDRKVYAPGVGVVLDGYLYVVDIQYID